MTIHQIAAFVIRLMAAVLAIAGGELITGLPLFISLRDKVVAWASYIAPENKAQMLATGI